MDVIAYYRLSKDRDEQTSIERQRIACRAYAASRGWEIIREFEDVDLSAYRKGVARPGYDAALEAVTSVPGRTLLVVRVDRLARRVREFERMWALCEENGAQIATVDGRFDSTTPSGRLMARMLSNFAEFEADLMSGRIRDALDYRASEGAPHRSGRRPFGLTADWKKVKRAEAKLIDEAVKRTLEGDSLRSIVLDWQARGVLSSTGKQWTPQALRHLLMSPRLAGQRSHHGVVVADGDWPALVSKDVSARLRALLSDPARRTPAPKNEWLLSGLLRCEACGASMRGGVSQGNLRYQCPPPPDGCFGAIVKREILDEYVVDAFLSRIDMARVRSLKPGRSKGAAVLADQIAADTARLDELASMFATGQIGRSEWLTARTAVTQRLDDARRSLASQQGGPMLAEVFAGHDSSKIWDGLSFDRRRAVLRAAIDRIDVRSSKRNRWVPLTERVELTWRV